MLWNDISLATCAHRDDARPDMETLIRFQPNARTEATYKSAL
jgi:hypothetical protein